MIVYISPTRLPDCPADESVIVLTPVAEPPSVYTILVIDVPLDIVCDVLPEVKVIVGVGFTFIVYKLDAPIPNPVVGVTVIVAVIGNSVVFIAVNEAISPVPEDGRPIAELLLVHVNVAPEGVLAKAVAATVLPLHTVTFAGTVTVEVGSGFTAIIPVAVDVQVLPTVVIVYVNGLPNDVFGVPDILNISPEKIPVIPGGRPVITAPVAPPNS